MNKISESVKERLFTVIEQLSEETTKEVLDFTESLLAREKIERLGWKSHPENNNPILDYIGKVSHGTLAKNIDNELYEIEVKHNIMLLRCSIKNLVKMEALATQVIMYWMKQLLYCLEDYLFIKPENR